MNLIDAWHVWVILGIVLWVMEIFTAGFILGVFGTAAIIVAPFTLLDIGVKFQLSIFALSTLILSFTLRPFLIKILTKESQHHKTNADALIGRSGYLVEEINNNMGIGRIKIDGDVWRAITIDDSPLSIGEKVTIVNVDGNKVIVKK